MQKRNRYVGNTMATFVMQSLGCEVAAINTVHFSNHTGYGQVKGTKSTAQDITALYAGLKQNYLTDFDVLLSGYAPSAAAVDAVGEIAMDLRRRSRSKPGSFFWVLDPVMGDQGRIYVNEDVVPAYKRIIPHADLILPNQFEAELLSGIKITYLSDLTDAITALHRIYNVPHIIVTSVQLPYTAADSTTTNPGSSRPDNLTIVGSTARSDGSPRLFKVEVPRLDCFFSGTGDMFAALTVALLREAVFAADAQDDVERDSNPSSTNKSTTPSSSSPPSSTPLLRNTPSWQSPDTVPATRLPLAQSTVKVLAIMHCILEKTMQERSAELARYRPDHDEAQQAEDAVEFAGLSAAERKAALEKRAYLRATKAAEVRLVRNVELLKRPVGVEFVAEEWKA
ncbi:pyridoxine kinase [Paracoccidioides lutzii Pb01]|uniref:pyridoxal kinase n=1 Tax=Paracoccidioides lutzii (strain ATCC MYA-826 / Pb01) TaxID=502779 RepID=C1H4B9_PARBA|nr:pyridoxine kinase [Paracoccidioides lutzii Pb01]EEH34563.2 pyridoxine kinase [Paracoccidioides lutzii Pb01]